MDLQGGQAVQLVEGKDLKIEGGDPRVWMKKFSRCGEVALHLHLRKVFAK